MTRSLVKLAFAAALVLGVAGCVYEPAPYYAPAPAPAYGYYAPPAYYGPSVALGFGFRDHDGRHWR